MKLSNRITISLAIPLYVLFITLYIILSFNINKYLMRDEENILQQKVEVISSQINAEVYTFARILLDNAVFIENNFYADNEVQAVLEQVSSQFPETNGFYVGFNDGRYKDGTNWVPEEGWDPRKRDWYLAGMKNPDSIAFCDPYIDDQTGLTCISLCKAIKNPNGKYDAVIAFDYYFNLIEALIQSKLSPSQLGMIIDTNGRFIFCDGHNPEEYLGKIQNGKYKNLTNDLLSSKSLFKSYVFEGKTYYFRKSPVSGTDWYLVFGIPKKEIEQNVNTIKIVLLFFFLFLMILNSVLLYLLMSKALKPLSLTSQAFNDLSGSNADLTKRMEQKTNDEIGMVASGFNAFIERLQNIVIGIKDSNQDLNDVNKSLQSSTEDTSKALNQIISNIQSVNKEIEKQTETVSSSSNAMERVSEIIDKMANTVQFQSNSVSNAAASVKQMVGNINSISTSVKSIYQSYEAFYEESQAGLEKQKLLDESVSLILDQSKMLQQANSVIANIASQTNLLAMNAAIEAAHAGTAGQGFSVVADEIRKLSETSSVQSKTIAQQLKNIVHSIDGVAKTSESSGAIFKSVTDKIQSTNETIKQLNYSMEEQQVGTNEILSVLQTMSNYTNEVSLISTTMNDLKESIIAQIEALVDSTKIMQASIKEMNDGTSLISTTEDELLTISSKMKTSVETIGSQINQFKS